MTLVTETLSKPFTLHLTLRSGVPAAKTYTELFDSLFDIIELHSHFTDFLSKEIRLWSASFIEIEAMMQEDVEKAQVHSEAITEVIAKLIHKLREEILVNPIDPNHQTLEEPYLDGDWVWEKKNLDTFKKVSKVSPYTFTPLDPVEHSFAKAMIVWMNSMVESTALVPLVQEQGLVTESPLDPELSSLLCVSYFQCAQNAMLIRANKLMERKQKEALLFEEKMKEHIDAHCKQLAEEERLARAEGEAKLAEDLQKIREENESVNQINSARLDIVGQQVNSLTHRLDLAKENQNTLENKVEQQQAYIFQLNNRINDLANRPPPKRKKFLGIF